MTKYLLNSDEVKKFIPHRYPFLFIDKIISLINYKDVFKINFYDYKNMNKIFFNTFLLF